MHSTIKTLQSALKLASFPNDDIRNSVQDLVIELGNDLESADGGYVEGLDVAKASRILEDRLVAFNVEQETDLDETIKNVKIDESDIGIDN